MLKYKLITYDSGEPEKLKEYLIRLANVFIEAEKIKREDIIDFKMNIKADEDSWIGNYYGKLELIYWSEK